MWIKAYPDSLLYDRSHHILSFFLTDGEQLYSKRRIFRKERGFFVNFWKMNSKHKSEVHILILLRSKRTHYSVNVEYSRLCRVAGPSVRPDQRGFTLFQNRQEIWDIEFCKKKMFLKVTRFR